MLSTPWLPVPVCKALACVRWSEGSDPAADTTTTSRLHSSPCSPTVVASVRLLCCNRHRAFLLVPPASPAERRESRESFSTVAKLLFVWQRLFPYSLSLSLSLFSHSCKRFPRLPHPLLLTAFKLLLLVASCRLFLSAALHLAPKWISAMVLPVSPRTPARPESEPRCEQVARSNTAKCVCSRARATPFFASYMP